LNRQMTLDRIAVDYIVRFAEDNGFGVTRLEACEDATEPPRVVLYLVQTYVTREPVAAAMGTEDEATEEVVLNKRPQQDKWKTLDDV